MACVGDVADAFLLYVGAGSGPGVGYLLLLLYVSVIEIKVYICVVIEAVIIVTRILISFVNKVVPIM